VNDVFVVKIDEDEEYFTLYKDKIIRARNIKLLKYLVKIEKEREEKEKREEKEG